jgi:hypothetical protein
MWITKGDTADRWLRLLLDFSEVGVPQGRAYIPIIENTH